MRGGVASGAKLAASCSLHEGAFGFSAQSWPGLTIEQLAEAGAIPHGKVSVTTVGEIRARGYDVVTTSGFGRHATVVVPQQWTDVDADVLASTFELVPNPRRANQ